MDGTTTRGAARAARATGTAQEVVVGVKDTSTTALRAVAWAAAEAALRGAPLRILHAAPYATTAAGRARAGAIRSRAFTVARRLERDVVARSTGSDAPAVPALVEASRTAVLLVLGRLSGHPGDAVVPSVVPGVVAAAACAVTVVRWGPYGTGADDAPVVLGLGDVERDAAAVDAAFAEAHHHRAPLLVRHVAGTAEQAHLPAVLHHALGAWRERYPDVEVRMRTGPGAVAADMVGLSVTARMVVVGSRGRRAATAAVLGSTSRTLLLHSGCPVTVVPRGGGERAGRYPGAGG